MKIILLNTSESKGGAAIAAKRIMKALRKKCVDTKMIVRDKQTEDVDIISVNTSISQNRINYFRFIWERIIIFIHNGFCRENLFPVSIANTGMDVSDLPVVKAADIIHIHWINHGFLSIKNIHKLIQTGKPVVWTMHDMWPCTGICHHARECNNFTCGCGQCFFLKSRRKNDFSKKIFSKKRKMLFTYNNITLVGCSHWLANKAGISSLSKKCDILSIPNPINVSTFCVSDRALSRKQSGLPESKKLLLFGAVNITDKRKGLYYLIEAINILKKSNPAFCNELCLVVFGQAKDDFINLIKIPVYTMGYLTETGEIVSLYNAVDLFITPSLEDNLPNTIMEAMACGTPCVGFDIGGIPEMIDHKQNGYVAEYKNPEDLAAGIQWLLKESDYEEVSKNARKKVEENYREDIVAGKYITLYENLLIKNAKIF
jgi:glycosyltransferase involved in cell wall biosynthesis